MSQYHPDTSAFLDQQGRFAQQRGDTVTAQSFVNARLEYDRLNAQALELCAEISKLRREREDFHMDYRMKCDKETKRLHVENERLRVALRQIADDPAVRSHPDSVRVAREALGEADQPSAATGPVWVFGTSVGINDHIEFCYDCHYSRVWIATPTQSPASQAAPASPSQRYKT